MPLWQKPIASGLEPETGGTFQVYNYPDYLYVPLLKKFCAKYNVTPVITPFDNIASGIQRLASRSVFPDVMEMTPDNLDLAVAGHLIKPLNLDYIPNLKKNIWPQLVSPFYDVGSRYTVPYTCYATGIFWRNDYREAGHLRDDRSRGTSSGSPRSTAARWRSSRRTARPSRWRSCGAGSPTSTPRTPS